VLLQKAIAMLLSIHLFHRLVMLCLSFVFFYHRHKAIIETKHEILSHPDFLLDEQN